MLLKVIYIYNLCTYYIHKSSCTIFMYFLTLSHTHYSFCLSLHVRPSHTYQDGEGWSGLYIRKAAMARTEGEFLVRLNLSLTQRLKAWLISLGSLSCFFLVLLSFFPALLPPGAHCSPPRLIPSGRRRRRGVNEKLRKELTRWKDHNVDGKWFSL